MSDQALRRRVPAEWEPVESVWLAWPHNRDTWPGRFGRIPSFYVRWVASIAESIPVRVLAAGANASECESSLGSLSGVDIIDIATNDCWIRDYGPTFVIDHSSKSLQAVNWRFNAWGGKYPPWSDDDAAASLICQHQQIPYVDSPLCLEGGAVELDGAGRLITTSGCLIAENRNPGWTKQQVEGELRERLGVTEILWLTGGGLEGDDTDGHVDQLARFVDHQNLIAAVCDDPSDPNHAPLSENFRQLQSWAAQTSPQLTVHAVSIPPARRIDGQRVPESYCNFLRLGPDRCQVPIFGAASDEPATALIGELTGASVEPIDCRDLAWGLGALHCASRDQPVAPRESPR